MPLSVATIYFNDNAGRFNKDLVDFLRRNLEKSIRQGRLSFSFKIVQTANQPELTSKGITRLPAMVLGRTIKIGVPSIIEEIRKCVESSKKVATPKTEEEIVREYQLAALGDIKKDADGKIVINDQEDENMDKEDLQRKAQAEMQRRGLAQAGAANGEPADRFKQQPAPRQPDRTAARDDDFEDRRPPPVTQGGGYATPRNQPGPRADNIDNPQMADAFAALGRVGRNATAEDRKDDELMATLLAKIGE